MARTLEITHLPTGAKFKFTTRGLKIFNESYSSTWNPETAFGRMDPILSFSSTQRKISFEIALTAESDKNKAASLARVMYPTYNNSNALSVKEPPIVRIGFQNLIQGQSGKGLICAIESLSLDRGKSYASTSTDFDLQVNPNQVVLQFDVIPLHEYDMGWFKVSSDSSRQEIVTAANNLLGTSVRKGGNRGNPRLQDSAVIYQFGSDKLEEIAFSSRKLNQIWSGDNWYATKKK